MNVSAALPPKPSVEPFAGLPDFPALERLKNVPQWVAWDFLWKPEKQKWDKPPVNPSTGRLGSSTDPATWGSYDQAADRAVRSRMAGVGFVLTAGDGVTGGDLDKVRDPATGALEDWAAELVAFGETYFEVSPSGTGVRFFAEGKIAATVKNDPAHVELYHSQRYLTLTGRHLAGSPTDIRPAPRTIEALLARVECFKAEAEAKAARDNFGASARQEAPRQRLVSGDGFFFAVNRAASGALHQWVPALFPRAKANSATGGYRVTSRSLGRNLEEDLSITPNGTVDFGVHDIGDRNAGKRSPIDLVIEHGGAADAIDAAHWLCDQIGIDAASLGWNGRSDRSQARDQGADRETGNASSGSDGGRRNGASSGSGKRPERPGIFHQGILVPELRDRLEVALALDPAPVFPVHSLPPLMGDMVAALVEHIQAPESLCAHSVISAAALATQGLADIQIPSLSRPMPLSLFMLVIAVSGERKSSCDGMALKAVSELEARLRETYGTDMKAFRVERTAYEGEVLKVRNDKKIDKEERRHRLSQIVEPCEPTVPTIRAEEPNLEGLMNLLAKGRPSVGVFTAEGGSFLGGHGMGDSAKVRTITGLSRLYDDGSGQRIRAKEITFINGRRVSVSLAVQPGIASTLLGDEVARDQGFVGRFLVCMPDSKIGERIVREARSVDDRRLTAFHNRMSRLLSLQEDIEGDLKLPAMHLDPVAWEVWRAMAQSVENNLGKNGLWLPVRATAQRIPENIARLAGILHLFCHDDANALIPGETMAIACEVGLFYLKEALRLCNVTAIDPETTAVNELAAWLATRESDLISPTIVQQAGPRHLRKDAKTTRARITALCAAGVLDLVGPGEIDGTAYREVYRFHRGGRH